MKMEVRMLTKMSLTNQIKQDLKNLATEERAKISRKFFKTGQGEYGQGDIFIGITVPDTRKMAEKYKNLSIKEIKELLQSKIHEYRLTALHILVIKFKKSNEKERQEICDFYLNNTNCINNWDLVDSSAHYILGENLSNKDKQILEKLARSDNLWERRIAIISTLQLIRKNQFEETFKIANILLNDKHDLIHKAVGWMLREVGKKNQTKEEEFLMKYYKSMPRTMLRYAIERFSKEKRDFYMRKD